MAGWSKALRVWPWLAAITTGFLCAGCFPPFEQGWLCWIALIPLLGAIWFSGADSRRRWLRDLFLGYLAGLAFFWTVFFWLRTVTVPGLILVGFYMAIYFAAWSWFCGWLRPSLRAAPAPASRWATPRPNESPLGRSPWLRSTNNLRLAFLLASAWVTQEWLRSIVFSGWGWNTLGHSLHAQLGVIQIAEYTGVAGLSFLVAWTNVILLSTARRFLLELEVRPLRPHFDFTLTMAGIVGVMGFGVHALQTQRPGQKVNIALVQSNIPREHKFDPAFAHTVFEQFERLSAPALRAAIPPDLIVWPESSMPGPVLQDEQSYRFVMDFSASAKIDLLLGTIDQDETKAYNAALLVSQAGQRVQLYRKVHLVPFGEYVPGRHFIPLLARIVGDQVPDDFAFGAEHTVFGLTNGEVRAAPLICFEDTIGELTRQFILGGANLLVNVTNDGWFLRTAAARQHLANAVFRCVETRCPLVRAANTGVTCFVNEYGRVTQQLLDENGSQFTEGVLTDEVLVPIKQELTFYVRHGELFAAGCIGVTLAALAVVASHRLVRRKSPVASN
ncbi:MAG: apolipoprotein N-acyltransferase [Verrucomicrobiota bacterium]